MNKYTFIQQANILYVEDDLVLAKAISHTLKNFCKNLYISNNGQEGFEQFKLLEKKIDIIITDINMPVLSGLGMIQKIRDINRDVPIVISSAFNDSELLSNAINYGIDGFVHKPISFDKLFFVLERTLEPVFYRKELQKRDLAIFRQSKFIAIEEMIGNVAHQWRQPLNSIGAIMMNLELQCELDQLSSESTLKAVEKTNNILSHLSKTIDDFRVYFSSENEKKVFLLSESIESMATLFRSHLTSYNIELFVQGDTNIPLFGHKDDLQQVLLNIISNAKDAIISRNIDNGFIYFDIKKQNKTLKIKIHDNANGINKENIDKLFDPYFTTKFQSQGIGLGLFIAHQTISKQFHGKISVINEEFTHNKNTYFGAAFTIEIPLSET